MKQWMHKVEVWVDKSIPYLLIVLFFLIVGEILYSEQLHGYEIFVTVIDEAIIAVFVADLVFKYIRIRNIPKFLRKCWLDILAVFPFVLVFRLFEGVSGLFRGVETLGQVQTIFHEGLELEKEVVKVTEESGRISKEAGRIVREVEKLGNVSRTQMLTRFIRPIARMPRFFKAIAYFEKPTGKHHLHEKKKVLIKKNKASK